MRKLSNLLILLVVALVAGPAGSMNFSPAAKQALHFTVYRDAIPIGHHAFNFYPKGDRLEVEIDVALEVKVMFVTAFKFRHIASEVWKDGRLIRMESETDDDGDPYKVRVQRLGEGLIVEVNGERKLAPGDILPSNLWNKALLTRNRMLHPILGEIMPLAVKPIGTRKVEVTDGRKIQAQGFEISAGPKFRRELWYGPDDRLVEVGFDAPMDGSRITYRLGEPELPEPKFSEDSG